MLMRNNGARIKLMLKSGIFHDIKSLKKYFQILEENHDVIGYSDNPEAIESWLRSSLVNMVFRGKAKENVASMRPLHWKATEYEINGIHVIIILPTNYLSC